MSTGLPRPFQLASNYTFLEDGGRAPMVPGGSAFWGALMSGPPFSPEIRQVVEGSGWLAAQYAIDSSTGNWERHPNGDELLIMVTGSMAVVFEMNSDVVTVELRSGEAVIVPAGVWHRQIVRVPGTYIGVTYGKGTEHRGL